MLKNDAMLQKVNILTSSSVLCDYFDNLTKLFSVLYVAKFLNIYFNKTCGTEKSYFVKKRSATDRLI